MHDAVDVLGLGADQILQLQGGCDGIVGHVSDGNDVTLGDNGVIFRGFGSGHRHHHAGVGPQDVSQLFADDEGLSANRQRHLHVVGLFALGDLVELGINDLIREVFQARGLYDQKGNGGDDDEG